MIEDRHIDLHVVSIKVEYALYRMDMLLMILGDPYPQRLHFVLLFLYFKLANIETSHHIFMQVDRYSKSKPMDDKPSLKRAWS